MNFDVQEHRSGETQTAVTAEKGSLQDLSLDDIDETSILPTQIHDKINTTMSSLFLSNSSAPVNSTEHPINTTVASNYSDSAMVNDSSCVPGQKFDRGCSETCECELGGKAICRPRCSMPFFRRGALVNDPACMEKPADDPCCSLLVCSHDTGNYTGLFISPSGISELCSAITKTDTAERSISTDRETLQVCNASSWRTCGFYR
jgi:hypothetical protein